ncbi:MAG: HEPN/Toprim-associated domain-containing protein, partial [Candidatus Acidiferrales bacterium]
MGSEIWLALGALELDRGTNNLFANHSALFLPGDIAEARYYYAHGVIEEKPAFVRTLRSIVRRLDLLGYTLQDCRGLYEQSMRHYDPALVPTFERFARVLRNVKVPAVRLREDRSYDLGEHAARAILPDP